MNRLENIYNAATLGLKDYCRKNNFQQVIIGLSGGIDSALVAAIAANAIGAKNVQCYMLPSSYTSKDSLEDAQQLADNLNITLKSIPIQPGVEAITESLKSVLGNLQDVTAQNLQSRLRGLLLMAISNQTGAMVVTTGNKSEMAVGYATLYGDMCGGYNPLKDIYKTDVFKVCEWLNKDKEIVPKRIITKPPSAELKPDQQDTDSLPPYEVLDAILKGFIEQRLGPDELIEQGFQEETVAHIWKLLRRNEYKRRQAPPGTKLTSMSFGRDWRLPITNKA